MPQKLKTSLPWPPEQAQPRQNGLDWSHPGSNLCLDFHGDPCRSGLTVFSDGNHHMALAETIQHFLSQYPRLEDIFYATTPPGVLVSLMKTGQLHLGNLTISKTADIFIGPETVLEGLRQDGLIQSHQPFMHSRGNVLLVKKGNPENILGITDLLRPEVRLFISNPDTEKASYSVYRESLLGLAREQHLDDKALTSLLSNQGTRLIYGSCIHHREAPQAIYQGSADVAMVYYHLALRYTRIFPDLFDMVIPGQLADNIHHSGSNIITHYHVAVVNSRNSYSQLFLDFLLSEQTAQIYQHHGLLADKKKPREERG